MKKKILVFDNMLFASPGHLMNHFRKNDIHSNIDIKYLTQCVFKDITNVKGAIIRYRNYDMNDSNAKAIYLRIKSLARSGEGYKLGMITPLDYYSNVIEPLIKKKSDPIQEAVDYAIELGIGTEKDYEELKILIAKIQDDLKATGSKKINDIQDTGREQVENLENKVKENPFTALACAFGVGLLASSLMSR